MERGAHAPLGAAWLEVNGQGRLQTEQRGDLRNSLLQELRGRDLGGPQLATAELEVERFIQNGHVSGTNLSRLERRVQQLQVGNSNALSARSSARSVSEFSRSVSEMSRSNASSLTSSRQRSTPSSSRRARACDPQVDELLRSMNAATDSGRAAAKGTGSERPSLTPVMEGEQQQQQQQQPIQPISTWSEVARYAQIVDEVEKAQKLQTKRSQQQEMRRELTLQMHAKEQRKALAKKEERKLFKHQETEIERWKDSQGAQAYEARKKAVQVERERREQHAKTKEMRAEEQDQQEAIDRSLVQRAARELDQEYQKMCEQKRDKLEANLKLVHSMEEEQKQKNEQRKLQVEEERRKVREYHRMLQEQQVRNQQHIPQLKTPNEIVAPPSTYRGKEAYGEEKIMQEGKQRKEQAEEAERQRIERLRTDREHTQEFLFQQMSERDAQKCQLKDEKTQAKTTAQEATLDHLEVERRKMAEQSAKNTNYRLKLEQQISAKKAAQQPKAAEDLMTHDERAINRRLLQESMEMRARLQAGTI
mmetsp:Transcript_55719/g.107516  ORF Transcript_55719/g.107516 Transcript_55719/m.107516 type:complete len:534 (-) Transcript_55719:74-1675(-)